MRWSSGWWAACGSEPPLCSCARVHRMGLTCSVSGGGRLRGGGGGAPPSSPLSSASAGFLHTGQVLLDCSHLHARQLISSPVSAARLGKAYHAPFLLATLYSHEAWPECGTGVRQVMGAHVAMQGSQKVCPHGNARGLRPSGCAAASPALCLQPVAAVRWATPLEGRCWASRSHQSTLSMTPSMPGNAERSQVVTQQGPHPSSGSCTSCAPAALLAPEGPAAPGSGGAEGCGGCAGAAGGIASLVCARSSKQMGQDAAGYLRGKDGVRLTAGQQLAANTSYDCLP